MYLEKRETFEQLRGDFRWAIPHDYNMAHEACDKWADKEPDRPALLDYDDGALTPYSYGWLAEKSKAFASQLKKRGVERGDRVAILLPQSPEVVVAHFAIYRLGAIALPLAMLFGPEALEYRLGFSGTKALITCADGLLKIAPIQSKLPKLETVYCVDGASGSALNFHREVADGDVHFERVGTTPDTPALMVFTSGTTGPPKGALHAHRVLAGHMPGIGALHEFSPQKDDRYWTPADWAWAGGLLNILMPGLALGVPVVCGGTQKFNPEGAFEMMARAKVRNTFIPPTALKIMRSVEQPMARFGHNLRTVFSGGEALGKETYEWGLDALGLSINEGYGQTECNLVLVSCSKIGACKAGSMGKPTPGREVAVIRSDGKVCEIGETGEIAIKRPEPVMFLKYWDRPDATEDKFLGDWMLTGDQGVVDEDGYFFFVGRDDDIITSAGFRIGPGEIEDCLIGHPSVKLAAAVGKPDPIRTEIIKCYVVLEDNVPAGDGLKADISSFVRSRLSAHEYPREIEFVAEMPLTTTGKVIRREFRQRAIEESKLNAPLG